MARTERPSIEELRALLALVETGSVSDAAERLGIKQPVVSRRLDAFRGRDSLIRSRGNKVVLTAKGRDVVPAIRALMRRYEDLKAHLGAKRKSPQVVRVATGSSASQFYLARAIALFQRSMPNWDVETRVTRGEDRILGVLDGSFDLAIVSHDQLQIETTARVNHFDASAINLCELGRQPLCVIARKDSPESEAIEAILKSHKVPVSMLCRWKLVGFDRRSGVRRQIEQRFATSSERPQFAGESGGWLAVKEFVKQGLGVGLLPLALLNRDDVEYLVVRVLSSEIHIRYSIVWARQSDSAAVVTMNSSLLEASREYEKSLRRQWESQFKAHS